jgi:hypothetical protein
MTAKQVQFDNIMFTKDFPDGEKYLGVIGLCKRVKDFCLYTFMDSYNPHFLSLLERSFLICKYIQRFS